MRKVLLIITVLTTLCCAAPALAGTTSIPGAAKSAATQLDTQLAERLQLLEGPAKGTTLILSTPVSLENMEESSPLSRLLAEELAMWFVQSGYRVQEIRKTKHMLFEPGLGELSLSRDVRFVDARYLKSAVILTGTYSQTQRNVRFNLRLLHAPTGEVLAMASQTIRITRETAQLLDEGARARARRIQPSVSTNLRQVSMNDAGTPTQDWNTWALPDFTDMHTLTKPVREDVPNVIDLTD
ncbi:FlgO family outer membrane protein [Desulfovibrio ferrophilus]|uniref:FlgO domain-containing protein n=1 Tax=Desulfovibrio ferrophilus TaxID=241368 RepID=A0A2Z6AXF3_9BACT|nr:FlgO family outer membrane protein [Desulfovibrio ferrophilus]BBD07885.1 uncharacterized protein DFE_1159 [Desulfovibrio ferrophilus]